MTEQPQDPLIPIGVIRKPHGIRGELSLALDLEDPGPLQGEVFLAGRKGDTPERFTVERARMHHGSMIVLFREVRDRNEAETLRQCRVLLPKSRLAPLDEDEVYLLDLPGLRVVAVNEENGEESGIGQIASVDIPAGQELWTIVTAEGREILFPAVDEFILDIDLEQGVARIAPPPGLLELYLK